MRKPIAIAVILFLCLSLITTAVAIPPHLPFDDVQPDDWFFDAVVYVSENYLMHGTSDTTFAPHGTMSRAMAVTVLHRLIVPVDIPNPDPWPFSDVQWGQWYSNAALWAADRGIVTGVGDRRFAPHDNVTREQFVVMLYRLRRIDYWVNTQLTFSDAGDVSPWAEDAMRWAVNADILRGANGMLRPQGAISRAESAAMLLRLSHYAAMEREREPAPMEFYARHERTNAGLCCCAPSNPEYPATIRSMDELATYMEIYSEHVLWWDMHGNPTYMNDEVFGMYTEEFFQESFLVILFFVENSGSNGHRVDMVLDNGDIHVARRVPPPWTSGTPDVAGWHIILEVENNIIPKHINLTVTTEERGISE